jgi:F-type H+-transporting ATPase subunit alpha
LEKGCQHKDGGSITILPIVETKAGDITDFISTNIISICDGQIVLSEKNFAKGEKPAIDYGLSVSRLGGNVQDSNMKKVGSKVRIELLSYLDVRQIYELANIDEMSEDLQKRLREGKIMIDKLKQYKFSPKSKSEMINSFDFIINENK